MLPSGDAAASDDPAASDDALADALADEVPDKSIALVGSHAQEAWRGRGAGEP